MVVPSASMAKLIIEKQGPSIHVDGVMLEGDAAVSWSHNVGLDSAYTLDIEHHGGAGGYRLRPEIIIEVDSHAGRRHIHNPAGVIPAPHYGAAERGHGMAQVTAFFLLNSAHADIRFVVRYQTFSR